jgi:hypothetical protein
MHASKFDRAIGGRRKTRIGDGFGRRGFGNGCGSDLRGNRIVPFVAVGVPSSLLL